MKRKHWLPGSLLLLLGLSVYLFVYAFQFTGLLLMLTGIPFWLFGLIRLMEKRWRRLAAWLRRLLWFGITLLLLCMTLTGIWVGTCCGGTENPKADYVIVLGAGVNGTVPSPSLQERLEAAQTYLNTYPEAICILSGGQGNNEDITEAECMFRWLTERGIPLERLRKEERATSTEENLLFSLELIEAELGGKPSHLGIISSEYHLLRAELLANNLGMDVLCYPAVTKNRRFFVNMYLREIFGVWVTLLPNIF